MKYLNRLLSLLILVSAVIVFTNCGGSDDPVKSEQQTQFEKLKFTWKMESVTLNGQSTGNAAEQFETLTLVISGSFAENGTFNYSLDAEPPVDASPWPQGGEWKFGSPVSSKIIRLDSKKDSTIPDVEMIYDLSDDGKTLTINIPEYSGETWPVGKIASVAGDWEFVFTRL